MHSPTILLLLSAVIGLTSGTIYWSMAMDKAQTQSDMILSAHSNHNTGLLYKLIPFGKDIDRYLADNHHQLEVQIKQVAEFENGVLRAIALIRDASIAPPKIYHAELTMTKSDASPTGYTMSKGYICHDACVLRTKPLGFI
ncbi:hypothetical protein CAEBREN_23734 [Caenorhabditis brenneri]|uniref:Uncharacterized protein n=1 Tax=Caenorhabditis brenneri TaxID=135651 RepID=G0MQG2_CAEBE|nr:hypothetical protein CAEBREN_23734 [Caenorhabditis brenneri]